MRGIISGFVATLVLTIVLVFKQHFHIAPELSVLNQLSKLAGGTVGGWMDHFIIGTLIWGMLFAGFEAVTPPTLPLWLKGVIFSMFAWLVAMLVFLPFVGMGVFGHKAGWLPAAVNLAQHVIYGLVLGITYGLLGSLAPAKAPERSSQT
jgi:hypothetical protein